MEEKQHDSDEEKEKTQKKTTFENDSDEAIPESVKIKSLPTIPIFTVRNLLFKRSHLSLD